MFSLPFVNALHKLFNVFNFLNPFFCTSTGNGFDWFPSHIHHQISFCCLQVSYKHLSRIVCYFYLKSSSRLHQKMIIKLHYLFVGQTVLRGRGDTPINKNQALDIDGPNAVILTTETINYNFRRTKRFCDFYLYITSLVFGSS